MLKLTKTVEYALISINYIENNAVDEPIPSKLISSHFSIPEDLLAKILQKLARSGILESIQGPHGGYKLNSSTNDINLIDFIELLEGPVGIVNCTVDKECSLLDYCNIRKPIRLINDNIRSVLEKTALSDITKGI